MTKARDPKDHGGMAERGLPGLFGRVIVCSAIYIVARIPLRVSFSVLHVLIKILFLVDRSARPKVRKNLYTVLGDSVTPKRLEEIIDENMFYAWAVRQIDMLAMPHFTAEFCEKNIKIVGLEKFRNAQAEGRGVLIVGFHHGSPFVGFMSLLPRLCDSVVIPARRIFDDFTSKWLKATLECNGAKVFYSDFAYDEMISELERGGTVVSVADHMTSPRGIRVNYFGEDTLMAAGPPIIAYRARPVVMPCNCVRTGLFEFLFEFGDPIPIPPTPEKLEASHLTEFAQRYIPWFEVYIRKYPEQWETYFPCWPKSFEEEDLRAFWEACGVVT